MENNDNGNWTYILERKENWLVGFLSVCWTIINCGMSIIISFFVNQQEVIPLTRGGLIGLFPYIYIWLPGICILTCILKRSLPICFEITLIALVFILSLMLSGQQSEYIEHFIRFSDLKTLCYQTVAFTYNTSQFILLIIWYIVRFKKKTSYRINEQKVVIFCFAFIIISALSGLIFDILKAVNLFPYII